MSDASRTVTVNSWHGGDDFIRIWVPLQGVMVVVVRLSSSEEGALRVSVGQLTHCINYVFPSSALYQSKTSVVLIPYVAGLRCTFSVVFTERQRGPKNLTSKTECFPETLERICLLFPESTNRYYVH